MAKQPKHLADELEYAEQAAISAGKSIAKYYGKFIDVTLKAIDQPLTKADLASNKIIKKVLKERFPDYGWLSEEDVDDVSRLDKKTLWIVDPLDGTKDFINKNPEFAVSIALVQDHEVVLGVVYNPISKELFTSVKGQGAFYNGRRIHTTNKKIPIKPHLLVSMSEYKRGEWEEFNDQFAITPTGGCAYKMCKIAKGDAHGTFTLNPKNEWDICAGTLIVLEAGGIVTYLDGEPVIFNQMSTVMDGLIYCCNQEIHKKIFAIVEVKNKYQLSSGF